MVVLQTSVATAQAGVAYCGILTVSFVLFRQALPGSPV
jgi:hypothetical protein